MCFHLTSLQGSQIPSTGRFTRRPGLRTSPQCPALLPVPQAAVLLSSLKCTAYLSHTKGTLGIACLIHHFIPVCNQLRGSSFPPLQQQQQQNMFQTTASCSRRGLPPQPGYAYQQPPWPTEVTEPSRAPHVSCSA